MFTESKVIVQKLFIRLPKLIRAIYEHTMSTSSTLSPFDMSGLGAGFGLYRPRRPSYTYATQVNRQRTESYRYAVRRSPQDIDDNTDVMEIPKRSRKESYARAVRRPEEQVELRQVNGDGEEKPEPFTEINLAAPPAPDTSIYRPPFYTTDLKSGGFVEPSGKLGKSTTKILKSKKSPKRQDDQNGRKDFPPVHFKSIDSVSHPQHENHMTSGENETGTPCSELSSTAPSIIVFTFKKNLVFLCISFITLFSSFRAIQNLQSSLNERNNLGIISMAILYGFMFITSLLAPSVINKISAKWALVIGMGSFLIWTGANMYPTFYTLIPTAMLSGFGQALLWTAEIAYIIKLAFDSSRISRGNLDREVMRFHGVFLACFQTTHIWGNLISSLMLSYYKEDPIALPFHALQENQLGEIVSTVQLNETSVSETPVNAADESSNARVRSTVKNCGVLYICDSVEKLSGLDDHIIETLWKLMCAYLVLGFIGFCLIFFCLDRIGAKVDPERTSFGIISEHIRLLFCHKTFRLLTPLLVFSGLQQGFIFADFTKGYVTCDLGYEYIGYSMIIMGLSNVLTSILVAVCARLIPREVVFGVGGVIHMAIMIGFLIWIPMSNLSIYFMLAALWGFCDAVWQTQCNTLICVTCPEETDVAFANYRMLQAFGLSLSFLMGTFLCVAGKLYILIGMLVFSIMFYVLAEYKVRQVDNDVFEDTPHN